MDAGATNPAQPATTKPPEPTKATPTDAAKPSLLNQDDKPKPAAGAPEAYTDFTAPEGFTLDPEVTKEAGTLFKSMNLSQEQGQQLVDFYAKQAKEAFETPFKVWQDTQEQWVSQIRADPEIGGKLDQVKERIGLMYDSLGDPKLVADFKEALNFTGAGNNPAFIKALYRIAQKATEGTAVRGGNPVDVGRTGQVTRPSIAAAMFPKLPSSQG